MNENTAPEQSLTPETAPNLAKKSFLRAWGIPLTLLVALAGSLYWVRYIFDPVAGQGWVNLMTVIVGGSITILLILWFCFLSYFSRRTVITTVVIFLVGAVGWAASVKEIIYDGDMNHFIIYRWQYQESDYQVSAQQNKEEPQTDDASAEITLADYPEYRGTKRDGIITGPQLRTNWDEKPLVELWRTPVGAGYASMAVVGNSLISIEQRKLNEAITCYDTQAGDLRWIHQYPAYFFEAMGGLGPRSTPTVSQGVVVSMGAMGDVTCLDLRTGKLIWQRSILKELKIPNVVWGMSSSPLVYGDTVCINPGGPKGNGLMGLDLKTGATIWKCAGLNEYDDKLNSKNFCGYSSPMLLELEGEIQIVIFDGVGLSGHDLETGKQIWHHKYKNEAGVNVAQPILLENGKDFFLSSSYSMGSARITVEQDGNEKWKITKHWHDVRAMRSKFSNPVYFQGYVYGLDEGILVCLDPLTGKKQWKKGRYGHGQVLLTHDQLLILAENGDLAIVKADPKQFQELARQKVLPQVSRLWNPHALANGIVYVRDHQNMAAYDLR